MTQFQTTIAGWSALQPFPIGNATWIATVAIANTNVDGTTGTYAPFYVEATALGQHGGRPTVIRIISLDATPSDTYRIFKYDTNTNAYRLWWSYTITQTMTEVSVNGLWLPRGSQLTATTNGGDDAVIYIETDEY